MRYRIVSSILVMALVMSASAQTAEPPIVWTAPSLSRIGMDDPAGTGNTITIHAAKGESESFQIAVRAPASGLTGVNVTATDFESGSHRIARSNVVLYREHYIAISQGSTCRYPNQPCENPPLGAGTYPDALIPFNDPQTGAALSGARLDAVPFRLDAHKNQPIWIDVHVPRTSAAGTYTSTFTISSDQGNATVTASLVVWNFELPLQPALKSAFLLENNTRLLQKEVLKHRLMPMGVYQPVDPADECELIENFGLNIASLPFVPFWSSANPHTGTMKAAPGVSDFTTEGNQHNKLLPVYCYTADEISDGEHSIELYEPMKQWARSMHEAGIRNLVTMKPVPELYDDGSGTCWSAVDIWVVLPFQYDQSADRCRHVQRKGDEVWSYNTLVQDNYSPKWHIDFAPVNFRIQPGFISQSLELTGLLYWRVDWWKRFDGQPSDPWLDAYGGHFPGDGQMVYPGQDVGIDGVAPSMRLKWLRDGVDDFDYVALLKKAGRGDWALQVSRSVGASWREWTRDPAALEAARKQLGDALSAAP